ncbi:MAG: ATP-grasp domain-containing protein [Leptospira sp.]|nr:ATP-grasp domain-containing protein [Leptospira sp.]
MSSNKGYFISVGGGENQLPLIRKVHSLGTKVVTIDKNELAPGFEYSRVKIIESTNEYRKVLNSLSHVPLTDKLVGIGCRSYGKASYTNAYIAEKLKLPGSPSKIIRLFLNKLDYLNRLEKFGIPIPKIITWKTKSDLVKTLQESRFPLILKPINGSGKADIEFFNTANELKTRIDKKFPNPSEYFLQEYIHGDEVTVMGMVDGKDFHLISISDKITTLSPPFIERAHILPSKHMDYLSEFTIIMKNISKHLGLKHTPFLAEFKIDEEGDIFMLEAVPEVGGEYLADSLIPNFYKFDYFKSLFALLTNNFKPEKIPLTHSLNKTGVIYFSIPKEKNRSVKSIEPFTCADDENLFLEKNLKEPKSSISFSSGNSCRAKVVGLLTTSEKESNSWLESIEKRMGVAYK